MFNYGGDFINTVVTSKEAILKVCRELVSEQGLATLNMRTVAEACHVALGSLYNYFPNKDELVLSVIESVWQDIFHMEQDCHAELSFPEYVNWIFESVRKGSLAYPNFFTAHSLSFASSGKNRAKEFMARYFVHMKIGMTQSLHGDGAVRPDAFTAEMTEADFTAFVLTNILTLLVHQKENCDVLLAVIRRTIY